MTEQVDITKENLDNIAIIDEIIIVYRDKDYNICRMTVGYIDELTINNHPELLHRFKNNILCIDNLSKLVSINKERSWYIKAMVDYQLALKHNLSFSEVTGLLLKDEHLDEWNELVDKLCKEYNVERIK